MLGILGLVVCQILGPFAWSIGKREVEAIDAGRRAPEHRVLANAGRIMGIIGTVLLVVAVIVVVLGLAIFRSSTMTITESGIS